jgi:hypothetical protein
MQTIAQVLEIEDNEISNHFGDNENSQADLQSSPINRISKTRAGTRQFFKYGSVKRDSIDSKSK